MQPEETLVLLTVIGVAILVALAAHSTGALDLRSAALENIDWSLRMTTVEEDPYPWYFSGNSPSLTLGFRISSLSQGSARYSVTLGSMITADPYKYDLSLGLTWVSWEEEEG